MVGSTYIQQRTKRLKSKYHQVKQNLESRYLLMQGSVVSKFHRENSEIEKMRYSFNRLMTKSVTAFLNNFDSIKINSVSSIEGYNPYKDTIDWTRRRFKGDTLHIVVKNGQIVEKVFLTNQGNRIIVERKDLGLFAKLSIKN